MLESQSEYAVRAREAHAARARHRDRGAAASSTGGGTVGSSRKMAGTSWTMSRNYFTAPTGKIVTQWPIGCTVYRALTKVFGRVSETTRRRATADQGFGGRPARNVAGSSSSELAVGVADEEREADVAVLDDLAAVLRGLRGGCPHVVDRDRQVREPGLGHRARGERRGRAGRRVVDELEDEAVEREVRRGDAERRVEAVELRVALVGRSDLVPEPEARARPGRSASTARGRSRPVRCGCRSLIGLLLRRPG